MGCTLHGQAESSRHSRISPGWHCSALQYPLQVLINWKSKQARLKISIHILQLTQFAKRKTKIN
jgi:hypothetical protein